MNYRENYWMTSRQIIIITVEDFFSLYFTIFRHRLTERIAKHMMWRQIEFYTKNILYFFFFHSLILFQAQNEQFFFSYVEQILLARSHKRRNWYYIFFISFNINFLWTSYIAMLWEHRHSTTVVIRNWRHEWKLKFTSQIYAMRMSAKNLRTVFLMTHPVD